MKERNEANFEARRVIRRYCQTMNAKPAEIFPLLCPVKEAQWLDGWEYNLIYSKSGLAEEGCVFSTPHPGEKDTIWIITKHDKDNHEIEFARFTPDSRTCVLHITVEPQKNNTSSVYITYTYTAISIGGNKFLNELTEDRFLDAVKFWEKSLNYFLETGERLKK